MNNKKQNSIIPEDISGPELKEWLEVNATETRNDEYTRLLTPDEVTAKQVEQSQSVIKLEETENEYKDIRTDFTAKIKSNKKQIKELSKVIRRKAIDDFGTIYRFRDFENMRIVEFTQFGQEIENRRMTPEERQTLIPFKKEKSA